jgi:hypothetical protein
MKREKSDATRKTVYQQKIPFVVSLIIISSGYATYAFHSNYMETGSTFSIVLASIFLVIFIFFVKPIVEWRRIEINGNFLTVRKFFCKPIRMNISRSLYKIVGENDHIRSYMFRHGNNYVQVSPQMYRNGQELSETLIDHMRRNKIVVQVE